MGLENLFHKMFSQDHGNSFPEIEKLELLHRFSLMAAPRLDAKLLRNILIVLTIFADRDTGNELIGLLKRI